MSDPTIDDMRAFLRPLARQLEADAFDVEAAIYWFAANYHGGQWTSLYSALSVSEFRPGLCHSRVEDEGDIAAMLYDALEGEFAAEAVHCPACDVRYSDSEQLRCIACGLARV